MPAAYTPTPAPNSTTGTQISWPAEQSYTYSPLRHGRLDRKAVISALAAGRGGPWPLTSASNGNSFTLYGGTVTVRTVTSTDVNLSFTPSVSAEDGGQTPTPATVYFALPLYREQAF